MELYARIRRAVMVDGPEGRREAATRLLAFMRNTIRKDASVFGSAHYRRREQPASKAQGPINGVDRRPPRCGSWRAQDAASYILTDFRASPGWSGIFRAAIAIVRRVCSGGGNVVIAWGVVPLSHRPGHAQVDFGEADGYIAGKKMRFRYLCMDLPHSDGCFRQGISGRDGGEPSATATSRPSPFSAACAARSCMTTRAPSRWRGSWRRMASGCARMISRNCRAITCSTTGSADQARATTKARLRDWSDTSDATS